MSTRIAIGDAREKLRLIRDESINCVITSPPYWKKRDYHAGPQEIGKEPTIQEYVDDILQVIDEIHRRLMPHGTFWLNIGDTYITQAGTSRGGTYYPETGQIRNVTNGAVLLKSNELPHKSLCLLPYRVAIAMQDRGWIIRNVIIRAEARLHAGERPRSLHGGLRARVPLHQEPQLLLQAAAATVFRWRLSDGAKGLSRTARNLTLPGISPIRKRF